MSHRPPVEIPIENFEIFVDGLDHPEGLAFDREGVLWAGGEAGQVYRIDGKNELKEITNIGGFCLGLTFSADDRLYICNPKLGGVVKVEKNGRSALFADRAGSHKLINPNVSVFDSQGNLYVSDSGNWQKDDGFIVRFDGRGRGHVFAGPFAFPNGLALSPDERFLYVAESSADDVLKIEIRPDGTPGERESCAEGIERVPDGLALDQKGNLYVSCYASDSLYRISESRQVQLFAHDRTGVMLARPTNIVFGGANGDELYVANLGRWHICRTFVSPNLWSEKA